MSRKILIESILDEHKETITKDLQIKIEGSSFVHNAQPTYIYPMDVTDDHAYVPFAYGRTCAGGPFTCPDRDSYGETKCEFTGELRPEQALVKKEAISHLNKYGSTIIAAYPGFGKCLAFNTPVMMFDGKIKKVQDIVVGEQLMGDDSTSRNVLSICKGEEKMYDIIQDNGLTYTVNESHILSLKISYHKYLSGSNDNPLSSKSSFSSSSSPPHTFMVTRFSKKSLKFVRKIFNSKNDAINYLDGIMDDDVLDIQVKDYLKLPEEVRSKLRGYKVSVDFTPLKIGMDPYELGLRMEDGKNEETSSKLPHEYKCNTREIRLKVLAGIIDAYGKYNANRYEITKKCGKLIDDIVFISRSLGFITYTETIDKNGSIYCTIHVHGEHLRDIPSILFGKFVKETKSIKHELTTGIIVVPSKQTDYYGFTLDGNSRFLLSDCTVTHNTAMAIYIASKIKLKTLIITHRIVLVKQWKSSILKFCPNATVQILTPKSEMDDSDFYIMNAINVHKKDSTFFKDIGFLMVDEIHCIMAEGLSKSMQRIVPRYVLGLSATPYREDGLNILLDLYFGKEKIYRKLFRNHTVYKIHTRFVPTVEIASNGRINWGVVLDSQANDKKRNEMIVNLVKHFPDRVFLILCKRVNQGNYLVKRLKEEGEDVTSLIGKQQEYEQKSRVLVGTCSKAGTGFDHPRLNAMILASDVQAYFIQYLGRCMRTEEVVPLVFDIVDKNPILDKHFRERKSIYTEHGGSITDFSKKYPNFEVC